MVELANPLDEEVERLTYRLCTPHEKGALEDGANGWGKDERYIKFVFAFFLVTRDPQGQWQCTIVKNMILMVANWLKHVQVRFDKKQNIQSTRQGK